MILHTARHASVEDELKLDRLHIDEVCVNCFMSYPHADMFHLDEVTCKGIVEPVLEFDKVRNLTPESSILMFAVKAIGQT